MYIYICIKNFAWEDQSEKVFYKCHIYASVLYESHYAARSTREIKTLYHRVWVRIIYILCHILMSKILVAGS